MTKEIEFRGLNKNGIWVYGDLLSRMQPKVIMSYGTPERYNDYHETEIIDGTQGQYIGKKDKDGNKIYNGDIITMHLFIQSGAGEGEREFTGSISIDEYGVYFNNFDKDDQLSGYLFGFAMHEDSLTVIGNIHQNPELRK